MTALTLLRRQPWLITVAVFLVLAVANTVLQPSFIEPGVMCSNLATFLPLILVYLVGVVISALLVGYLSDRIRRRKVFVVWGALIQALAAFILVFVTDYSVTFVAGALLGLGYGAYLAVGQALATQVLPSARDRAKDLGIMNVAYQVPVAVAPLLGALVVATLGGFDGLFMIAGATTALGAAVIALVNGVK